MNGALSASLHECKPLLLSPVSARRPAVSISRVAQNVSFLVLTPQHLQQDG